ncbi:unnamed protein product [Bursaphelenchus okinawaensis]|uniref:Uncharacterized protein n=1 Tax=Bursaphelenchus okinawaensis TaxID=465554 RepID=A0A811KAG4_9BILA|nr:unnamed protein product [Bursaphelenchus okinawaensis]CAG9094769.1 unnamed protein product [Bursaphelenchus okinawaensis]
MMSTHLMNGAQDVPDFYSAPGDSSIFKDTHRDVITYTEDGRALIAGKLLNKREPSEMWNQLILQMMCQRIRVHRESIVKRFFSRHSKTAHKRDTIERKYVTNISISD